MDVGRRKGDTMSWKPCGAATMVGSMPHRDHGKVVKYMIEHLREIPTWPQLPAFPAEQITHQYLEGMPGYDGSLTAVIPTIRSSTPHFDEESYAFYDEYLAVIEGRRALEGSRFAMGEERGIGMRTFLRMLPQGRHYPAVKGHVIGALTLLSSLKDEGGRLLLFDDRMSDIVPKHLALKGLWQAEQLKPFAERVIIFYDEPALGGFGSSAFIGLSRDHIRHFLAETAGFLRARGVLVGVHVCANTDWSLLLDGAVDIVNYDAYNYSERFFLYREDILEFLERGGIIAWGIVPTDDENKLARENADSLYNRLEGMIRRSLPDRSLGEIFAQSLITPSCGCGILTEASAEKVLRLTVACAERVRQRATQ